MIVASSISGTIGHWRQGLVDFKMGGVLLIGSVFGSILGIWIFKTLVSSGQAASAFAIQNLCKAGDNIVSSTDLYGGTWNQFANTFKQLGIEVIFA